MKKNLFSILTMMFLALSFVKAQNPSNDCKLKADFAFKPDNCTVAYTNKSTADAGSVINKWFWTFGDGTSDSTQHPKHVYKQSGKYQVCLTTLATNKAGKVCKDNVCNTVEVKGCGSNNDSTKCRLAAKFEAKVDSCTAKFADNSSAGKGTNIIKWYWTFGDGTVDSTHQNPSHVYKYSGYYNVCLTIVGKNAAGEICKDKECHGVSVKSCAIQIDSAKCRLAAQFKDKIDNCKVTYTDASSAGLGTTITKWYWSFGDGTVDSVSKNPTHAYAFSGHYNVCLTIVGKNLLGKECRDKECHFIDVKGCATDTTQCRLNAKFSSKNDSCTVIFTDNSTTAPGASITKRYWSFGDGAVDSTHQNPVHTYAHNGVYNVCLSIVGKNANSGKVCKDRECHMVAVKGCGNVIDSTKCRLAAQFKNKIDNCKVSFTDASSAGTGTTIVKWYWSFGDGAVDSVSKNPTHAYAFSGHYNVCLTIVGKNLLGKECRDKECHFIDVKGCATDTTQCRLNAKFSSKSDSCTVIFTDNSTTAPGVAVTKRYWSFGDGAVDSTHQNPTHVYAHDGHYNVCLTIVGKNATSGKICKDRECHEVFVKGCAIDPTICRLTAKFDYKKDSTKVTFDDNSVASAGTTIKKWYWSFGDGAVDSVENPVHIYAKKGKYKVCLTIVGVNASGRECKDMTCDVVSTEHHKDEFVTENLSSVSMLQLFPNPATDAVNINFKVDVAGQVNISVADIQGRVLAVIQDGYMTTGYHNVSWNIGVHPGWYMVTIKTNDGIEQKQLLIQQQ